MRVHLVGFGSQGSAWAECLRASGFELSVSLSRRDSASFRRATELGFAPTTSFPNDETLVVPMLVPDHLIGPIYRDQLAGLNRPLLLVLAHGYAVYAGELARLAPGHAVGLLAPKAIGPKLREAYFAAKGASHALKAAFHAPAGHEATLARLAHGLGFADANLISASFEQEAIGDLISEQALLTGGVFNLIDWTTAAMRDAGVPDALIREECLTELELIAGLVRELGPAAALAKISQAAQCGTILMRRRFEKAGIPGEIAAQARSVVDRGFVTEMRRDEWRRELGALCERLTTVGRPS